MRGFIGTRMFLINDGTEVIIMGTDGFTTISKTEFVRTEQGYIIDNMVDYKGYYKELDDMFGQ